MDIKLDDLETEVVLAAEAASPGVRLVGGSGLALLLNHRRSEDLDLFERIRGDIQPVVRAVEDALSAAGKRFERVRAGPGFVRIEVPREPGVLRIDVSTDTAPLLDPRETMAGPIRVESLRDQRANKMVALLGRSELRDLIDLYFIETSGGLRIAEGFEDALRKDSGMDPGWFAWALDQIRIHDLPGMVQPLPKEELERFRVELRQAALDRAGGE